MLCPNYRLSVWLRSRLTDRFLFKFDLFVQVYPNEQFRVLTKASRRRSAEVLLGIDRLTLGESF